MRRCMLGVYLNYKVELIMAVQKNKPSRSKRNMRRAHDSLTAKAVSENQSTGETHLRHHMTKDGYFHGRDIFNESDS